MSTVGQNTRAVQHRGFHNVPIGITQFPRPPQFRVGDANRNRRGRCATVDRDRHVRFKGTGIEALAAHDGPYACLAFSVRIVVGKVHLNVHGGRAIVVDLVGRVRVRTAIAVSVFMSFQFHHK